MNMSSAKTAVVTKVSTKSHLEDIEETWFQHFGHAMSFSLRMFGTGFCCMVHAFFPELFKTTGSDSIRVLHDRMVVNRRNLSK